MLSARLARSWTEGLPCGGSGAGGAGGPAFATATGGGGAGGDSGDGDPVPLGTGGAGTLPIPSATFATPVAADAADVATPPPSIAPAVSVAARAPPATAPTPPVAATAATGAAPNGTPFPISAAIPTRSPPPIPRVPAAIDPAILGIIHDANANRSIDIRVGKIWVIGSSAV